MTPQMKTALLRMEVTDSAALIRVGSQWWAAETDAQSNSWGEVDGRFRPTFPAVTTSTVRALVRNGLLKFKGKKIKTTWPPYTPDHFRAERTCGRGTPA